MLGPLAVWAVAAVATAWGVDRALVHDLVPVGLRAGRGLVALSLCAGLGAVALGVVGVRRCIRSTSVVSGSRAGAGEVGRVVAGLFATVVVVTTVAAGVLLRADTLHRGLLPALAAYGGTATLDVTIATEPRPIADGWHLLLRVRSVDGTPTRELAAATLDADPPPLGARWRVRATARPLPDGGYGRWLAQQHAVVALDLADHTPIAAPGRVTAASEHVRSRVRAAATRHLDDRVGGLLVGFVTGDTRLLPEPEQDAMRATGLTHLTAVSGSNVAIVLAGVSALAVASRLGARGRRRALVVTVVWFAFVTRFEPSVLRAGTMAAVVLLAGARGVAGDARHALCGAVLLLVLLDPLLATSLGLLLSATATVGVLVLAPVVRARLPARLPRRLAEVLAITLGAQLAVVPLLLATFGEVPLASVPANVVAVPAAAVAAVLAFVGASLASLVHVEVGALPLAVAGVPARVVLWSATTFAEVGGTVTATRPVTVVAVVAAAGWLLARPGGRAARAAAVVTLVAVLVAALPMVVGGRPPSGFAVTAIDVGQGDAFLVETPRTRVLVDAGEGDDAAAWLRSNGRRRLDLLVVTHPHLDHLGGAPEVLRRLDVGALWFRPVPTPLREARVMLEVASERGVSVRTPEVGETVTLADLTIEVLHPPPGRPYRWSRSEPNDTSLTLRLHHDGRRALFPGDIEAPAQLDLLAGAADHLHAELLAVPHHGSSSSEPAFLAAIGAQVGLVSAGADNRYGHPAPATLAALAASDVEVRRTDRDGTVRVEVPAPRGGDAGRSPEPSSGDRSDRVRAWASVAEVVPRPALGCRLPTPELTPARGTVAALGSATRRPAANAGGDPVPPAAAGRLPP